MTSLRERIIKDLESVSNSQKADILQRFFKTRKGEYGEGDIFVGIVVPNLRAVSKKYFKEMEVDDWKYFISSKIHEYRLFALLSLTYMYETSDETMRGSIYSFYIANLKYVNNWDLVDLSAPNIVGRYLKDKERGMLYELANSGNLWKQRVSIVATYAYIKENDFADTLDIAKLLLNNKHDLIHKAVGWMLREVGKRDQGVEEDFLKQYFKEMPRTMLRYAIERFDENKRQEYLKGLVPTSTSS